MKILLAMKFWTNAQPCPDRVRNVRYNYPKMLELAEFLTNNGIDCAAKLYDFSFQPLIIGSVHRPFPDNEYKRSEKINIILRENSEYDYIFLLDCDTFFEKNTYCKVLQLLQNIKEKQIYTFDLAKVDDSTSMRLVNNEVFDLFSVDWWFAYSGPKENGPLGNGTVGGLGGVFLCDIKLLRSVGGFDETYIKWGGEDGDVLNRILIHNRDAQLLPQRELYPFHLSHPPVS